MRTVLFNIFVMMFIPACDMIAQQPVAKEMNWSVAGQLPAQPGDKINRGLAGTINGILGDQLIVAGGNHFPAEMPWRGGSKKYFDDVFVFEILADSLRLVAQIKLPYQVSYSAVAESSKGIISAGGENADGLISRVILISRSAGPSKADKSLPAITRLPDLPYGICNASLVCVDNYVYLTGGEDNMGTSAKLFCLDLDRLSDGWKQSGELPNPVSHAVAVPDNNSPGFFLVGGRKKNAGMPSSFSNETWFFDHRQQQWKKKTSLPYAIAAGTGIAVDGQIWLFGGDRGVVFNSTENLMLQIESEKDQNKKQLLQKQKILMQENHPGFPASTLIYDIAKDIWKEYRHEKKKFPVTTSAVRYQNKVFVAGGELRAGVRTAGILWTKIL